MNMHANMRGANANIARPGTLNRFVFQWKDLTRTGAFSGAHRFAPGYFVKHRVTAVVPGGHSVRCITFPVAGSFTHPPRH